uniref:Putative terminase n=1 Tax=viral metagenome TaxID=1070528 RepID=A0A6H1ZLW7_9ZZZZ
MPSEQSLQLYNTLGNNMALFGKLVAPDAFYAPSPPFHYEIYRDLMNKNIKKLGVAAPRNSAKSMVATKINVLHNILHKDPNYIMPIVIISESESQSIDFLYDIKSMLVESELINSLYSEYWGFNFGEESSKKWTETQIILPNKVKVVAKGTGQKIRGSNYLNVRPRLIILDDFESEHNTDSPEAVVKNRKWVTNAVIPALADDGRIVIIGNMVSDDCFIAWIKENASWTIRWYQAIDDDWQNPLWPERFPKDRLLAIRKYDYEQMDNPFGFWREYMNIPVPPDERSIKPDDIRYWDDAIFDWRYDLPCMIFADDDIRPLNLFMGIDPAPGNNKDSGDYYVRKVIGIDKQGRVYVIEYRRERIEVNEQGRDIVDTYLKYHSAFVRTTIETTGYQESLRSVVRDMTQDKNIFIPGLEKGVKPRNAKSSRHDKIVGIAKTNKLFIKQSMEALKTEMFTVHNTKRSPDCMDALWNALYHSYPYMGDDVKDKKKEDKKEKEQTKLDWMEM